MFFTWYITRLLSRQKEEIPDKVDSVKQNVHYFKKLVQDLIRFVLGLGILLVSSWGVVWSATAIAEQLGVSLLLIGLILLAIGTTLPEISFGLRSVWMKHEAMTLGNFIGSVAFNALFVLGLVALISPIIIQDVFLLANIGFFLFLALTVFNVFIRTKDHLSYKEGLILVGLYVFFLTVQVFIR